MFSKNFVNNLLVAGHADQTTQVTPSYNGLFICDARLKILISPKPPSFSPHFDGRALGRRTVWYLCPRLRIKAVMARTVVITLAFAEKFSSRGEDRPH